MSKNTSISLGDYFDQFVRSQVSAGRYKNVSQVIRAGLRLLENEKIKPIVLSNGVEIKYREFVKAQMGKESSCSLENKNYLHFSGKFAIAIYGKKAKDGLYILTEK